MSPAKPKSTGAMALLEKYSALNRGMDEARRENARNKSKVESMRQQIQRLRVERHEMEGKTEQAREETARLHKDVQEALAEYAQLEDEHAQALLEKMNAHRQCEFTKQFVEEERQGFLEASRDFRTACKRMRLAASAVGEDMATSKSFLEIHQKEDIDFDSAFDGNVIQKDEELDQAMEEHERLKKARDKAERSLRAVQLKEKATSQKSSSRSERKAQLLAQLDRVRKDNSDLERQLKAIDQQTREAREMAHSFERGRFLFESRSSVAIKPFTHPTYAASLC